MSTLRLLSFVGARPQFIKAAVLSRLAARTPGVEERLVHTGQHYDEKMSQVFFDELDLPRPHHALGVGSGSHAEQTGRMMIAAEQLLQSERPDAVVVYGDTNSTIAASLAAAKLGVPVAHVEAGLRSFDRSMPEEVNRCVTDHLSAWHFCPTRVAVDNLRHEGIANNVFLVGDVMCDAVRYYSRTGQDRPATLDELNLEPGGYALATMHRAGNTDDPDRFAALWAGLGALAQEIPVVLPVHPRTRKVLAERGLSAGGGLHLVEPVGYREMLSLERHARLIVTDSGGVQKEAYLHAVPCLTMRDNTEWTETVEAGWNVLVGCDADRLLAEARRVLRSGPPTDRPMLYGDGHAGEKILDVLTRCAAKRAA